MYPRFDPLKRAHRSTTEVERLPNAHVLKHEDICVGKVLKRSREDACDADIQRPQVCLSKAERHETKAHLSKNLRRQDTYTENKRKSRCHTADMYHVRFQRCKRPSLSTTLYLYILVYMRLVSCIVPMHKCFTSCFRWVCMGWKVI